MASFSYTAKSNNGQMQTGTLTANDRAAALKSLADRQMVPVLVKESTGLKKDINLKLPFLKPKVKTKDLVIMTRQLSTMVNAGVPIVKSLATLRTQTESAPLKAVLSQVMSKVQDGAALSDSLAEHPKVFSIVYVNMVRAGETGGILDKILDRLAFQLEKDANIRGKVRGAMIYPSVIMVITFGAFFFLMTGIVPKLKSIFDEFGSQLPLYTRVLLSISGILQRFGALIIIGLIGLGIVLARVIKTPAGKLKFNKLELKLPIFGKILLKVSIARFSRTFSSLTSAGVSVLDGLKVTGEAIPNLVIKNAIMGATDKVRNGQPISTALSESGIFPPMVWQMIAVGEETGQVDAVLSKVADFYEEEVDRVVASLTSVIEPLLILVLGGMVGLIAASVFGPISNLSNVVK